MNDQKIITLGDVYSGKANWQEYYQNCYERNKDIKCHRQFNGYSLCADCPKTGCRN